MSSIWSQPPPYPDSKRSSASATGSVKNSDRITRQPMYHELDLEANDNPPPYQEESESVERNHNRPYLLSSGTYNRLRVMIFLGGLCLNVPWSWNRKKYKIDRWNPFMIKIWQLYWYFTTVQSTFMIIYHTYCLIGIYSRDLKSYRGIFAYSLIVYWYACHLGYKTCIFLYEDRVIHCKLPYKNFSHQIYHKSCIFL